MRTFKSLRAEYGRLRARYYTDAEPPLRVPLPAGELRWTWVRDHRRLWGMTHFDEDGDPHLIEVPWEGEKVTTLVLLHELSHMRNPRADCGQRGWWREECRRLQGLDAFGREGIF